MSNQPQDVPRPALAGETPQDAAPTAPSVAPAESPVLHCLVCGGTDFQREVVQEPTQYRMHTFYLTVMICRQCGFAMHFMPPGSIEPPTEP